MENEDLIREQMEETRSSMTDKLEKLENKVVQTVTGTTDAVTETVEAVKDTVKNTTEAVTETVEQVKESVQATVQTVTGTVKGGIRGIKNLFTPSKHPWFCMGASVIGGFVVARMILPRRRPRPEVQAMTAATHPIGAAAPTPVRSTAQVTSHNGGHRGKERHAPPAKGFLQGIADQLHPELDKIKGMALGMLVETARDLVMRAVPAQWKGQVSSLFSGLAEKLHAAQPSGDHVDTGRETTSYHTEEESSARHAERSGARHGKKHKFDR
jgi:hypothetical protein